MSLDLAESKIFQLGDVVHTHDAPRYQRTESVECIFNPESIVVRVEMSWIGLDSGRSGGDQGMSKRFEREQTVIEQTPRERLW